MPGETSPPMSREKWYRPNIEANTPPLRARCRVQWGGRVFVAWRDTHPKTRRRCWSVEIGDGLVEYWPPKQWPRNYRDMGDEPDLFQPRDPEHWEYPLPEPVAAPAESVMVSSRGSGRFSAMSAQAAQSDATRREIESALGFTMDDLARERAEDGTRADDIASRWWRDASLVTYSPQGDVTLAEAEARVLRAILTDALRPWKHGAQQVRAWPQEFTDWIEAQRKLAEDPKADLRERFAPSRDDIRDSLVAMGWFAKLDPPQLRPGASDAHASGASAPIREEFTRDQVLLILRAIEPPYTWRQIGQHELVGGVSHTQARRFYKEAIDRVWRAANGMPVFKHVSVRDELGALRERNRAHKRSQAGV